MKRVTVVLLVSFALAQCGPLFAQTDLEDCGWQFVKNWKVRGAAGLSDHLQKHIKIEHLEDNKFRVELKTQQSDGVKYTSDEFKITECSLTTPPAGMLSGEIKIDGCRHQLAVYYPYYDPRGNPHYNKVGIELPNAHEEGECLDHSSGEDEPLQIYHYGTAHGSD